MVKVNYDVNGKILGFYPDNIDYSFIPEPYVEISEIDYQKILPDTIKYRVCEGKLVDISNSDEYMYEQRIYEMAHKSAIYKKQISDIELSQNRLIREYLLKPTSENLEKIKEIDLKISKIRDDLSVLVF